MFQITNQIIWTLGMVHCHVWLPEGTSNVIRFRMITAIQLTWDLLPPKSHDYIWKSSSCVGLGDPYQLHPKKKYYSEIRHVSTGSKYQNCCSFTTSCGSMRIHWLRAGYDKDSHQMSFCRSLKTYLVSIYRSGPTHDLFQVASSCQKNSMNSKTMRTNLRMNLRRNSSSQWVEFTELSTENHGYHCITCFKLSPSNIGISLHVLLLFWDQVLPWWLDWK